MSTATLETPEINRATVVMKERAFRGIGEMYEMGGLHEPKPVVSDQRARRVARILLIAGDWLDGRHLELLEQIANLCAVDSPIGGPAWDSRPLQRQLDELTAIVKALSFDEDRAFEVQADPD